VEDVEALSYRLEDVWMGECKMKVNKARFGREHVSPQVDVRRREVLGVTGGGSGGPIVVTYKEVVANVRIQKPVPVSGKVVLTPSEERLKVLESCFVAEMAFFREPN
jgi:hypothetical protein